MSRAEREEILQDLIAESRLWTNDKSGRDFDYHESVDIAVDGTGSDNLNIGESGFVPLVEVTAMTVSGSSCTLDDYVYYREGRVVLGTNSPRSRYVSGRSNAFPRGRQNVELTISWGYEEAPLDIKMAQTRRVLATVLLELEAANADSAGLNAGYDRIDYGDLQIRVGGDSRYGDLIDRLNEEALKTCFRYRDAGVVSGHANFAGLEGRPS